MVPFGSSIIPRQKRQGRRFPFGFFPLRGFRRLRRTVADVMCPSASSKDQILRQNQQLPRRLPRRPIYFIIFPSLMSYCIFWPSFGRVRFESVETFRRWHCHTQSATDSIGRRPAPIGLVSLHFDFAFVRGDKSNRSHLCRMFGKYAIPDT